MPNLDIASRDPIALTISNGVTHEISDNIWSQAYNFDFLLIFATNEIATITLAQSNEKQSRTATQADAVNIARATLNGAATNQERISIIVVSKIRNEGMMDRHLRSLFRPGSPLSLHFLDNIDTVATYAPSQSQARRVADYLTRQGFSNVRITANRLLVTADGTVQAVRSTFRTEIARHAFNGYAGITETSDAKIPNELENEVNHVLGLQTLYKIQTFSHAQSSHLTTALSKPACTSPEFASIYHAGNTPTATKTTAAVIGRGSMTNPAKYLTNMEQNQGFVETPPTIESIFSTDSNDDAGQIEWGMGARAIVSIRGGVKRLIFCTSGGNSIHDSATSRYYAPGNEAPDLLKAINLAVSDNTAKVINMSCGAPECEGNVGWADSVFKLGLVQGQTFVAVTGDNGAYPCQRLDGSSPLPGSYSDNQMPSVNYPASSPHVVAVGGTTLCASPSEAYISKSSWPYSGGGISEFKVTPSWQPNNYPNRELSDLAFGAGNINSDVAIYLKCSLIAYISQSLFGYVRGGTSLVAPLFVGAWARLDATNNNTLRFAAPTSIGSLSNFRFTTLQLEKWIFPCIPWARQRNWMKKFRHSICKYFIKKSIIFDPAISTQNQ